MARRSSDLSSLPTAPDINTPDGSVQLASVFGDYTSSDSQYEYPWPEKDRQSIETYKNWLNAEWERVEVLHYRGPTGEPWPKKPKIDIKKLDIVFVDGAKKGQALKGQDLHDYLVANCTDFGEIQIPQLPEGGFSSLATMTMFLKLGWDRLKQANGLTLRWYMEYGILLNQAFAQHELDKDVGKISNTWDEWLKDNVGISSPQGRKIRTVASLLSPYPRFKNLGLSFSEVYSRRKQIETMLQAANRQWSNYWRQISAVSLQAFE